MPIDAAFLKEVATIYHPRMGTEQMGPLLYSLLRFTRPKHVLEIGMGYTTCFILRALEDNARDVAAERDVLIEYHQANRAEQQSHPDHPFALPDFYRQPYEPVLHAIDDLSHPQSGAEKVVAAAKRLGLTDRLHFHDSDFRGFSPSLPREHLPIDFVWLDAGGYVNYNAFASEYWDLINPDGGQWLIHSTMTNLEGIAFLNKMKLGQATDEFNDYELVSLLEPHKLAQNSFTIIRRTDGYVERLFSLQP